MANAIDGKQTQARSAEEVNIDVVKQMAALVSSSLGPRGRDKMLVDNVGSATFTNDGATILRETKFEHPTTKIIVSLAKTQEAIQPIVALTSFPQLILSGVFFPISSMHEFIQPIAHVLPLSVVVSGLRSITNDGMPLLTLNSTTIGIGIWMAISFLVAIKYFVWKEVAN